MLIKTQKRMNHNKIIAHNIKMSKKYKNFPRLPSIVKTNKNTKRLEIEEINSGHTESVFRGYLKRVGNFQKTYL